MTQAASEDTGSMSHDIRYLLKKQMELIARLIRILKRSGYYVRMDMTGIFVIEPEKGEESGHLSGHVG